jgi:hypothetical protein
MARKRRRILMFRESGLSTTMGARRKGEPLEPPTCTLTTQQDSNLLSSRLVDTPAGTVTRLTGTITGTDTQVSSGSVTSSADVANVTVEHVTHQARGLDAPNTHPTSSLTDSVVKKRVPPIQSEDGVHQVTDGEQAISLFLLTIRHQSREGRRCYRCLVWEHPC